MLISIIIPVFNEEKIIESTLKKLINNIEKDANDFEIILVDDCSSDNTVNISSKFEREFKNIKILKNERNRGKGYSIKKGMLAAKGDLKFFMDADLSTPLSEIESFVKEHNVGKNSIIIASRRLKNSAIIKHQPIFREILGKCFTALANLILCMKISDFTCGFKCFDNESARTLFEKQMLNKWVFDAEILFIAKKNKIKIKELPVVWENNRDTKVKLIKDIFYSFFELIKIRFYDFFGYYK